MSISDKIMVLVLLTIFTVSCQSSSKNQSIQNPLDIEARKEAKNLWDSTFKKCEDTYVGVSHESYFIQLKNPEVIVSR